MLIKTIHLKNYRCFDALSVDFHPQMTVLVALNGQGKSTLLDAIKVALWPYVAGFDLGSTTKDITSIHIDDVRRQQIHAHEMDWRLPAEIHALGEMAIQQLPLDDTSKTTWQSLRYRESIKKGTKTKERRLDDGVNLTATAKHLEQRIFSDEQKIPAPDALPMLGYYGTGRLWAHKKLTSTHEKADDKESSSRTFAYRDCLDPASSYKHFSQWYTRIFKVFREAQIRHIEKRLPLDMNIDPGFVAPIRAVQNAINHVLSPHTGWKELEYSAEYEELILHHDQYGQLMVNQLSDGIRNMLALVGDIAYRCYKLNAHLGETAPQKTQGIVLIDEIDMHLHPSWQQTVLADLMTAFPKLQFIVSTHSPQVLTTVPRENIRILHATKTGFAAIQPEFSPLAHESGDALAKIMGTHREPELPLQNDIRRYEQLVRCGQENSVDAQHLRTHLEEKGYQFHESDLITWRFLAARKAGKTS